MSSGIKRLFGTDGIRGVANSYPMVPEIALKVGKALGYLLSVNSRSSRRPRIILGKDTRLSGYIFEQALSAGIASMDVDVMLVGPLPTPAIAFLTSSMRAEAGIVISASHNPYQDNGFKIFDSKGFKLPDKVELEIEDLVLNRELEGSSNIGKAARIDDAAGRYIVFVKNSFPHDMSLDGLKIVLDCANGSGYKVGPSILEELGAEVTPINVKPDGKNINVNCGSLDPSVLRENVVNTGADLGIALDGDADRVIFCDEYGNEVDGDRILAVCTEEMMERKELRGNTVVATTMSNMGLEHFLNDRGVKLHRTDVGDRNVVEAMRRIGANLGGEKSGHIIFMDHTTTGDGLLASLQILSEMKRLNKPLSEIAQRLELFPQVLRSVDIRERVPIDQIDGLDDIVSSCEKRLENRGRINIRYSGTELKARVMVEGDNEGMINSIVDEISGFISDRIGMKDAKT